MEQNTKKMNEEEELNSRLIGYIKNQLKKGFDIGRIRNRLIEAGHDIKTITKCINKIELYRKKKFNMRNIVIFIFLIIILAGIGSYFLLGDRYYLKKGVSLFDQGNYEEALEQFNKSIELNPKNYKAHNYVGLVYFQLRAYDQAIKYFNKAIELKPNRFMAHNRLGISYYQQKKYDLAIEQLNKAIELNPKNYKAHNYVGLVYFQLHAYDQAIEYFNKAIELNPHFGVPYNNSILIYHNQGNYYMTIEQAINVFKKGTELNPHFGAPYSNLILIYHNQGNYDRAIEQAINVFKKGTELKPNRFMAHNRLGICYYQQKKYDLAIEQFNKAIELNPDRNSIAFKLLDQTYSQLGQDKLAEEKLNKTSVLINESLLETPCYFININKN